MVNDDKPDERPKELFKDRAQSTRFLEASDHPYECKCKICQEWWELVGLERD